jgi:hypothetical protein
MKKSVKISRASFPGVGNFSWMNFFVDILKKKYDIQIDSDNPDLVIYTNQFYRENELDYYTKKIVKGIHEYDDSVKKIFISGEARPDFMSHLSKGDNYFVLGYEHINHDRYLRFPTYVLDTFVLHNEGGMFDDSFSWLTTERKYDKIKEKKKHFCSIVQASFNPDRDKFFDLAEKKHFIKSSGPYRTTVPGNEMLNPHKYHNYSSEEYMGKIDGLTYRDKVEFFSDCVFNMAFQFTDTDYLTQEKIIHSYASNSIPVFYGNKFIEDEGFNPNSFINGHKFENFEQLVNFIDELYNDEIRLKKYFEEPIFTNNKLPIYFEEEYVLNFFDKIIETI